MFRIGSNWRTGMSSVNVFTFSTLIYIPSGRCSINPLTSPHSIPSISRTPTAHSSQNVPRADTHIILAGNITITASSRPSQSPEILLNTPNITHRIQCPSSKGSHPVEITALTLDQSPPNDSHHIRLITFLSSGEFTIFLVNHQAVSQSTRLMSWVPVSRSSRTSPII